MLSRFLKKYEKLSIVKEDHSDKLSETTKTDSEETLSANNVVMKLMLQSSIREGVIMQEDFDSFPKELPEFAKLAEIFCGHLEESYISYNEILPPKDVICNCFCYFFFKGAEIAILFDNTSNGEVDFKYNLDDGTSGIFDLQNEKYAEFNSQVEKGIELMKIVFEDINLILLEDTIMFNSDMDPFDFDDYGSDDDHAFEKNSNLEYIHYSFYWAAFIGTIFGSNKLFK